MHALGEWKAHDRLPLEGQAQNGAESDWVVIGLLLAIAGCFLLANAILFRHPRDLVEEHFGAATRKLGSIRTYLFHRVQVSIGFLLLLCGFGLQLFGRLATAAPNSPSTFPVLWVGLTAVAVVALELFGWWLSRRLFQRYVREFLIGRDLRLESDSKLAREVGALFSVELLPEDTVLSYAARVRERMRLPEQRPRPAPSEVLVGVEE